MCHVPVQTWHKEIETRPDLRRPAAALAGLGVGGIAVALAAQKTLENVIGGVSLIMDGAVRVGEFFKIGDVVGTIEVIGLRSMRVRTLDRTIITIPNGQVATMTLENFSARDRFWLRQLIGLGYQTASSKLNTALIEVRTLLERDPRVLPITARVSGLSALLSPVWNWSVWRMFPRKTGTTFSKFRRNS